MRNSFSLATEDIPLPTISVHIQPVTSLTSGSFPPPSLPPPPPLIGEAEVLKARSFLIIPTFPGAGVPLADLALADLSSLPSPLSPDMLPYATLEDAEAALGRSLTAVEALWLRYSARMPDYLLYCHNILFLLVIFSLAPLPLTLIELCLPAAVSPYKLQPKLVGIRTGLPLPSLWEVAAQLGVYFLVEDYGNYWIHRLMHGKWGYEKIHHVHHEFTAPIGFAAPYAHWAEVLLLGIPSFVGPAIAPCHMITFWIWIALRQLEAIETHSGYDFPLSPTKFIPFYGGAEYHDYHHYVGGQSQSNFASVFTYCDYIYGTDKGYRYHKACLTKLKEQQGNGRLNGEVNGFINYGQKSE
ncbi:very-long-chain aldehyde decarbonylase GL1-10-like isoform X2 [Musa acuminata AAA Group]|uniref:very-long-chain aldehyde decarbonylase GL1-10-like isoform X2 n=1 Tax=Musa acuminata AAA Group TaxID=214697 RepID=UPI0031DAFDE2